MGQTKSNIVDSNKSINEILRVFHIETIPQKLFSSSQDYKGNKLMQTYL
jgi:hypothetical protein